MPGEVVRHNLQIHKEVLGGKLYWKRSFLSFYLDHDRNLLCFCRTNFHRVINMHSTCQKKSVEENRKGQWKKFFRTWKKSLRRVCHNFTSHVHENSLDGKIFWNNFNFQIYSYTKRKKVRLLSKLNWPSGESCILRVHWKNMGIKIWVEFFSGHWIKTFQFSVKKYWPGLSKLHFTGPKDLFTDKYFLFFFDRKNFSFLTDILRRFCQKCSLRVQTNVLKNNGFSVKIAFFTASVWVFELGCPGLTSTNISAKMKRGHSTCASENHER